MTVTVLIFYTRRPEVTPEDFQSHLEEIHLPIIKEVFDEHQPLTYTMHYVQRVKTGAGDRLGAVTSMTGRADPNDPVVLIGQPSDLGWDAMGKMTFRDELHIQQALAIMETGGQRIKEDEDLFALVDLTKVVVVGQTTVLT